MNLAMSNIYVIESQDSVFSRKPSRRGNDLPQRPLSYPCISSPELLCYYAMGDFENGDSDTFPSRTLLFAFNSQDTPIIYS